MSGSQIKLRWSSISTFSGCQRKYKLAYVDHIVSKPSPETRARMLGSHVHAGLQAALLLSFDGTHDAESLVSVAVRAVRAYHAETYDQPTIRDYATRLTVPDPAYPLLMEGILQQAIQIVTYQVPRIGLGTKYRVANLGEVLGIDHTAQGWLMEHDVPLIEWNFSRVMSDETGQDFDVTGTVDTVLCDLETGEFIMMDWKTRSSMPEPRLVDLDGQLKLYAAIINRRAGRPVITRTCQYQVSTRVPQPPKLTEKKGVVSMAAPSSTWEFWSREIEHMGDDPAKYEAVMRPKMHDPEHYTQPIFSPVSPKSSETILDNVLRMGAVIAAAEESDNWPALPSIFKCQFCEYKRICSTIETGGDVGYVIENEYAIGAPDDDGVEVEAA